MKIQFMETLFGGGLRAKEGDFRTMPLRSLENTPAAQITLGKR